MVWPEVLTRSFPLFFVHLGYAICVDNLHTLEEWSELWMFAMFCIYFVELCFVYELEFILESKPGDERAKRSVSVTHVAINI